MSRGFSLKSLTIQIYVFCSFFYAISTVHVMDTTFDALVEDETKNYEVSSINFYNLRCSYFI